MIEQAIGRQRLTTLVVLTGALAMMSVVQFGVLRPFLGGTEDDIEMLETTIEELDQRLAEGSSELDIVSTRGDTYEALQQSGFLGEQERLVARNLLNDATIEAGLQRLSFKIQPAVVIEEETRAADIGRALQESRIELTFSSALDLEIVDFLAIARASFPGYLSIDRLEMRKLPVDPNRYAQTAASGSPLIEGRAVVSWITLSIASSDPLEEF